MTKNQWSPVGSSRDEHGYTLIELLVVLAMIALLAGAVPVVLSRSKPGYDVRYAADLIANELRNTRRCAIRDDREYVLRIDNQRKLIFTAPAGVPKEFARDVSAESASEADREAIGVIGVRFYADGSADRAVIRIGTRQQERTITVDDVTGRVGISASDK